MIKAQDVKFMKILKFFIYLLLSSSVWGLWQVPATVELRAQESFGGVGIMIDYDPPGSGNVVIYSVSYKSPADQAGIKRGERLMRVDGQDVTGRPLEDVARLIRGPQGSSVTLTLAGSEGQIREVPLTRKSLPSGPSVALPPPSQVGQGMFLTPTEKDLVKQKILGIKTDAQRQRMLELLTQLKNKQISKPKFLQAIKAEFP